jgi:hypothetical protein
MMRVSITLAVSFLSLAINAEAADWRPAQSQTCAQVCSNAGRSPVISGLYIRNNNPFYVCRANAQNEGQRGGYNLEPSWADVCVVEYGNGFQKLNQYDCLCE